MSKHQRHLFTSACAAFCLALCLPLLAMPVAQAQTNSIKPMNMAEASLQAAYETTWNMLDREYANRDKVPADWNSWQHKFDGQLHSEQDLTIALNKLIDYLGDPQIRLRTTVEVAAAKAKESGWKFGYGLSSKWLPVNGPTATIRVDSEFGIGWKAGLRNGDKLLAVNGSGIAGLGDWDLFGLIGSHRDQVTLTIRRDGHVFDIVAHPGDTNANYGLDIGIYIDGNYGKPYVFTEGPGPAQQAGIGEKDELELVNGKPADEMSDAELKLLSGNCTAGQTLHLKVKRLANEVAIPCGLTIDSYMNGTAGGAGSEKTVWQVSLKNLDQPNLINWTESFLAEYAGKKNVVKLLDLRGAYGSDDRQAAKLASFFMRKGTFNCIGGGWRTDTICNVIDSGIVVETNSQSTRTRNLSTRAPRFDGKTVVIIDDETTGTALLLAGALQHDGATIVTSGTKVRALSDRVTRDYLQGDPAGRWIEFPVWHETLARKRTAVIADVVVEKGKAFEKAQELLKLKRPPYDQRAYD